MLLVNPSLFDILFTCVSTTMLGMLYTFPRITLAVFRPTPSSVRSESIVSGTCPWKLSISLFAHAIMFFDLFL